MLRPYRVLSLTDHRGELAGMLFGDLGADVVKIEPRGGSSSRHRPPRLPGVPDAEQGLGFLAYNRNQRGVTLDLEVQSDRDRLLELLAGTDFLVESLGAGVLDSFDLGFDHARRVNPRIVYTSISAYGQSGPHAGFAACDLTVAAMSGALILQGSQDRPPVRISVSQVWQHASVEAVIASLSAHTLMLRTQNAQHVDVSVQCAFAWNALKAMVAHAIQGFDFERQGATLKLANDILPLTYECRGGYALFVPTSRTLENLVPLWVEEGIVAADWIRDEAWRTWEVRLLTGRPLRYGVAEVVAAARIFFRDKTKAEVLDMAVRGDLSVAPIHTLREVLQLRQLAERDFWIRLHSADRRTLRAPGAFAKFGSQRFAVRRPPPRLGEHNEEIVGRLRQPAWRAEPAGPPVDGELPLAGVKVADFSWIGVGPWAARYLADLGATVVRVETSNPADRLRSMPPFKDNVPGPERSQFFGHFNASKLGLALNLKRRGGVKIAQRLLRWADVYLESFTPGTMESFGLGYQAVKARNPSVIMVSTSLMGQTGSCAKLGGFGTHGAAVSGFHELTGWPDRAPDGPWLAYTDTVAPRFVAAAILAALDHRRRTGEGNFIDIGQVEAALVFLAPQLIALDAIGEETSRIGNGSEIYSPHGVYPCLGDDQWCAIAVTDDRQWPRLCEIIEQPDLARDGELTTAAGRRAREREVDRRIARWTSGRPSREVMHRLQQDRIPAGAVQRSRDLLRDPQLRFRDFFCWLDHPVVGSVPYSGLAFQIAGATIGPRSAAPLFGQHSELVLREFLGLERDEIDRAFASGAVE